MNEQILELYALAQSLGTVDFVSALELAAEQHLVGAEYVNAVASTGQLNVPLNLSAGAILSRSSLLSMSKTAAQTGIKLNNTSYSAIAMGDVFKEIPAQNEVERDLGQYEQYVANRQLLLEEPPLAMTDLTTTIVKVNMGAGEVKVK
jgi:hypothetical protein